MFWKTQKCTNNINLHKDITESVNVSVMQSPFGASGQEFRCSVKHCNLDWIRLADSSWLHI